MSTRGFSSKTLLLYSGTVYPIIWYRSLKDVCPQSNSRFLVVDDEADQVSIVWQLVTLPHHLDSMACCDVGFKFKDVTFTCCEKAALSMRHIYEVFKQIDAPDLMGRRYSQLALSPLLRKSPSSGFTVMPVLSHILWISDMQSLGFKRKNKRPFRIVRLCWFQSHRCCRFWLLMAENAYMLMMEEEKERRLLSCHKGWDNYVLWWLKMLEDVLSWQECG